MDFTLHCNWLLLFVKADLNVTCFCLVASVERETSERKCCPS